MDDFLDGFPASVCETSDPLVEAVLDTDHPCHNCHTARSEADMLGFLLELKALGVDSAAEVHEALTEHLAKIIRSIYGPRDDEELNRHVSTLIGQLLDSSLDELDENIELNKQALGELLGGCKSGPISLVGTQGERMIGAIVCGSSWLEDGDNLPEAVHVTRRRTE